MERNNSVKSSIDKLQARGDLFTSQLIKEKKRTNDLQVKLEEVNAQIVRIRESNKQKAVSVLQNIISQQRKRHEGEICRYEMEQRAALQQITKDSNSSLAGLSKTAESLIEKNDATQVLINDTKTEIISAERDVQEYLAATKQKIAQDRQKMHTAHKQRQRMKERVWAEKKKAEIEKMTWRGMSATINRLMTNHDEACSAIKCNLELSKEKLDAQYDNETLERIQSFQHIEERSNSCVNQKQKDLEEKMSQECAIQDASLLKLKSTLLENFKSLKNTQAQDTATLIEEHGIALSKMKSTMVSKVQLSKESTQIEMKEIGLHHIVCFRNIDRELLEAKTSWEKEQVMTCKKRFEKRNEQNKKILLKRRENEIKRIIRAGLL